MQQGSEFASELEQRAKKKKQEIELKEKKADLNKRISDLREKMLDYVQTYGIEDYRTQMMISVHDMALQVEETVKTIEAFNTVTLFIGETVSFMDESYALMDNVFGQTINKKFTLFERIKNKIRIRKSIRCMNVRMRTIADNMASMQKMTLTMKDSMGRLSTQLRSSIEKNNLKQAKRDKKAGKPVIATEESPSYKICRQYMETNHISSTDTKNIGGGSSNNGAIDPDQI